MEYIACCSMVKKVLTIKKHKISADLNSGFNKYKKFIEDIEKGASFSRYGKNKLKVMSLLAIHGLSSTWQIGQLAFPSLERDRSENIARQIFDGKIYRGKRTQGLVSYKIAFKKKENKDISATYGLTLFGLLYTIKNHNFTDDQLFSIATNNVNLLPNIFKYANYLKSNNISLKPLQLISRGNFLDLNRSIKSDLFYTEMFNFLLSELPVKFNLSEGMFKNFIALWYFTFLHYYFLDRGLSSLDWIKLIKRNNDLLSWYNSIAKPTFDFFRKTHKNSEFIMSKIQL